MQEQRKQYPMFWLMVCVFLVFGLAGGTGSAEDEIEGVEPFEVTKAARPSTYWWWMGNAVSRPGLTRLLEKYHDVGFGGVKIDPIYGAKGYEKRFIDYLSPRWVEMLQHTGDVADRLGMTVDLATCTGWNMGGPWVRQNHAGKRVVTEKYELKGGETLQKKVRHVQQATGNVDALDLERPISANKGLHKRPNMTVRFKHSLPLQAFVAYPEEGEPIDLMSRVGQNGQLDWTAPGGQWRLYAVFQGEVGKFVERPAPGGTGWMIDIMSREALDAHLSVYERAFAGYDTGEMFRGFHDDSYEGGNVNWTGDLLAEFQRRRGYDLRKHLPALFGKGSKEKVARVKADYRRTASDLVIEEHMRPWRKWAHERGNKIVAQNPYHIPANALDAWAVADIPECTGNRPFLVTKMTASAAHVAGRRISSAETCTWLDEQFQVSLAEMKDQVDTRLLGGINHIAYHSTAYSPSDARWPGWLYYASTQVVPTNTIWRDLPALNRYITRVCTFMQTGRPDNDVLLYYPVDEIWHDSNGMLYPLGGLERAEGLKEVASQLRERGFTFDFISDRQIAHLSVKDGQLVTSGGNRYDAVMVPGTRYMRHSTFQELLRLVEGGGTVALQNGVPPWRPGLKNMDAPRGSTEDICEDLDAGQKRLITGDEPAELARRANIAPEPMVKTGLEFVRRRYPEGHIYFVKNTGKETISEYVPLAVAAEGVALHDPLSGRTGVASSRQEDGATEVYLQLRSGESCLLRTREDDGIEGEQWTYLQSDGETVPVEGRWQVSFTDGGPELPDDVHTDNLKSWTKLGGKKAKAFAGTARYEMTFRLPDGGDKEHWLLDLGRVCHSARVKLNGRALGTLITPPFRARAGEALKEGKNRLVVEVTNLAANRVRHLDRSGIEWKGFYNIGFVSKDYHSFDASDWDVMDSGLLGPVRLIPAAGRR